MLHLWRLPGLAVIGIVGVLAGAPTLMTIPLEEGNTWVYEYEKTTFDSSESPRVRGFGFRRTGVLMMQVDSVRERGDSTLFTLSYSDSFSQAGFGDSAGVDSSSTSYMHFFKEYCACSDGVFSLDTNGWLKDADQLLSYDIEPDSSYELYGGTGVFTVYHYSRTSDIIDVRVGSLASKKYGKTIHMDSTLRPSTLPGAEHTRDDSVIWIDRSGLFRKQGSVSHRQDGPYKYTILSQRDTAWSYTLISYNDKPFVVGTVAPRPVLRQAIDQRNNSALIVPWVHFPGSSASLYLTSPLFNLRGQPVKNILAGQLMIRPAIRQDGR